MNRELIVEDDEDPEVENPCPDCGEGPVSVLIGGAHCPVGCGWVERWEK